MGPFEHVGIRDNNEPLYCSALQNPDDIICEGSDTEQTPKEIQDKRLRYEEHAKRYLRGQLPILQSASLRGPLDEGWINPWRERPRKAEDWWQPDSDNMLFTRTNVMKWADNRGLGHLAPTEALARCKAAANAQRRSQRVVTRDHVASADISGSTLDVGYQSDSSEDPLSQSGSVTKSNSRAIPPHSSIPRSSAASKEGSRSQNDGRNAVKGRIRWPKREADHEWLKGSSISKRARWDSSTPPSPSPVRDFEGERSQPRTQEATSKGRLGRAQIHTNLQPRIVLSPKPRVQNKGLRLKGREEESDELSDICGATTFLSALDSLQRCKAAQLQKNANEPDNGWNEPSSLATRQTSLAPLIDFPEEGADSGMTGSPRLLPTSSRLAADPVSSHVEIIEGDTFVTEVAPSSGNASEFKYKKRRKRYKRFQHISPGPIQEMTSQVKKPAEALVESTPIELDDKRVEDESYERKNTVTEEGHHQDTEETRRTPPMSEFRATEDSPITSMPNEAKSTPPASNNEISPSVAMANAVRNSPPPSYFHPGESSPGTIVVDSDSIYLSTELQLEEILPGTDVARCSSPPSYLQPGESSPGTIVVDTERASYLMEARRREDSPMEDVDDAETESFASNSKHDLDFGKLNDITPPPPSPRRESPCLPPLPKPETTPEEHTSRDHSAHRQSDSPMSDQQLNTQPSLSREASLPCDKDSETRHDSQSDSTEHVIRSQIKSEMNLSIRGISSSNEEEEVRNQVDRESSSEEEEGLLRCGSTGETSQTLSHGLHDLDNGDRAAAEKHDAPEQQDPGSITPSGQRQEQENMQESYIQSPWVADDVQLPASVDLQVKRKPISKESRDIGTALEEGVIPDSDLQSPERPKTPEGDRIIPFKEFMSPSPSPSRTRAHLSLGGFPNTQVLVDAATNNPWAKNSEPRRKKKVSFGLPDDEQPESASSVPEAPRSPPPPQKMNLLSQDDVFDDGTTTVVNTFQKHFAAASGAGQRPFHSTNSPFPTSSPAVGAMAEAFIAADRETSVEQNRLASGDESPSRHLQPMSEAMANSSPEKDGASPGRSPQGRGNAGLDEVDLDAFLGEAGGFLEEWSVETELRKTTTPTEGMHRSGLGSDGKRLLFGEMW